MTAFLHDGMLAEGERTLRRTTAPRLASARDSSAMSPSATVSATPAACPSPAALFIYGAHSRRTYAARRASTPKGERSRESKGSAVAPAGAVRPSQKERGCSGELRPTLLRGSGRRGRRRENDESGTTARWHEGCFVGTLCHRSRVVWVGCGLRGLLLGLLACVSQARASPPRSRSPAEPEACSARLTAFLPRSHLEHLSTG